MSRKTKSVASLTDQHNHLIDKILDVIGVARETGDPITLSLLKMALLREVDVLNELPETDNDTGHDATKPVLQ